MAFEIGSPVISSVTKPDTSATGGGRSGPCTRMLNEVWPPPERATWAVPLRVSPDCTGLFPATPICATTFRVSPGPIVPRLQSIRVLSLVRLHPSPALVIDTPTSASGTTIVSWTFWATPLTGSLLAFWTVMVTLCGPPPTRSSMLPMLPSRNCGWAWAGVLRKPATRAATAAVTTPARSATRCTVTSTYLPCRAPTKTMPCLNGFAKPRVGWTTVTSATYRPVVSGEPEKSMAVSAVIADLDAGRTPDPRLLADTVRSLLRQLAAAAPGRSVEVRVPPYGAIQCIAGPRHTRGTPSNVVETDPATWVLVAVGRLSWAEAVADGRIRTSGNRADLSAYLPVAIRWPPDVA